ncbi:MASE1 domain-containing protein [Phyllobacterium zundukense]|uniref:MASE1 domain-containing protein n=1 Tax=Phyllobacterium zundukense TaxID=1867719 RepID=A0ACD4D870_9HYPH|nr:MASE1 domain-containing protein [Phyllobacterium zundukense]UXN62055.1 MASE1 domain-containing protein [Phyllobacterium zundukense]
MTRVWSYRPPLLHLGLFFLAYVLGCGFAQALAIVPGTGISIWPPSGLFIAALVLAPMKSWPWWVLAGGLAELLSNILWFHSPLPAAFLMYAGNALEAVVGAWLVNRALGRPARLETLQEVIVFVVLGAVFAPVVSATVGSATLAWFGILSQTFVGAWPLWWIGDATGVLIVAPLALVVIQNWHRKTEFSMARWMEACVLGLILLGVAALSLGGYLPFAYIIMPPLLWAAVRFEFKGAVVTLALLALITAIFTISGASQFAGDPETQRHNQIMLQLFLAISAFSALIVAAISRQHQLALLTLRQSVEALRDRERELSQIVDMVPVHIRRLTPEGEPTFFNKRLVDFFGLDLEQLNKPGMSRLATNIETLVHPDDASVLLQAVRHSVATGEPYSLKYRMRRADGVYRWVDGRAEPLRDDDGTIVQWFAISIDIDDEVRALEALQQSERRYRDLFHYMPIGLTQVDASKLIPLFKELRAEGVTDLETYMDEHPEFLVHAVEALEIEEVNQHVVEMFGAQNAEEMYGPITRYWQPGLSTIRRSIEASYRGEEVFQEETKVERMDGSVMDVVFATARPGAVADKSLVGFIDITERKKAEEALQSSKQQLEQMIDALPINILSFAPSRRMTYASKRYLDSAGSPTPDIKDFDALARDVAHPEDFPTMFQRATNGFATGQPFVNRFRRRTKDGLYRWIEARAQPLRAADGAIVQWYIASIDIEDEMQAQEALRNREREFSQLVDMVPSLLWRLSPTGEPTFFNKRMMDFFGVDTREADMLDTSGMAAIIKSAIHPDDSAGMAKALNCSLATGKRFSMRYRLRRADGVYRWVDGSAEPLRDESGRIVQWYGLSHDIDDDVRTQEELRRTQERLAVASQAASLAELSASIAHEVNQPLAAIVANSHACHRWLSVEPPNVERATTVAARIIRDANAAADIVSRIRGLFRQSTETRNSTTLASVVTEAGALMAEEGARHRVRMDISIESDLPAVTLDSVQIQQVLINLIRNGMDAMDLIAGEKVLQVHTHRLGSEIQTEINDHGRGIEFPDRIFEPFFTTKENGMGMGLAICRSIVEAHGGRLWAEKNEPHGARFIFTLPIATKAAP